MCTSLQCCVHPSVFCVSLSRPFEQYFPCWYINVLVMLLKGHALFHAGDVLQSGARPFLCNRSAKHFIEKQCCQQGAQRAPGNLHLSPEITEREPEGKDALTRRLEAGYSHPKSLKGKAQQNELFHFQERRQMGLRRSSKVFPHVDVCRALVKVNFCFSIK